MALTVWSTLAVVVEGLVVLVATAGMVVLVSSSSGISSEAFMNWNWIIGVVVAVAVVYGAWHYYKTHKF